MKYTLGKSKEKAETNVMNYVGNNPTLEKDDRQLYHLQHDDRMYRARTSRKVRLGLGNM
jgi:hypothetical protein